MPGWRIKRVLDLVMTLPAVILEVVSQILLMGGVERRWNGGVQLEGNWKGLVI